MLSIKQNSDVITMPDSCFPETVMKNNAFRSLEVRNFLLDLDADGGVDPNVIFPLFFC